MWLAGGGAYLKINDLTSKRAVMHTDVWLGLSTAPCGQYGKHSLRLLHQNELKKTAQQHFGFRGTGTHKLIRHLWCSGGPYSLNICSLRHFQKIINWLHFKTHKRSHCNYQWILNPISSSVSSTSIVVVVELLKTHHESLCSTGWRVLPHDKCDSSSFLKRALIAPNNHHFFL